MEYTTDEQSTKPAMEFTMVDNTPTIMAQTLMEMGKMYGNLQESLSAESYWRKEEIRQHAETKKQLDNYIKLLKEASDRIAKREAMLDDIKMSMEVNSEVLDNAKRELVVRDTIIERLLKEYSVTSSDKRKIKNLLKPITR